MLTLFLLAGFLYTQDAQAQSFTQNDLTQLNEKNGLSTTVFVEGDEAVLILKQEVAVMYEAAADLEGGSVEATNNLTSEFYTLVMDNITTGETVYDAITTSYPSLIAHSGRMDVPVNTESIVSNLLNLLTL